MFGVCSGVYFCPLSVLYQPPPHLLHSLVSVMHTCSVFLTEVHQPPGDGGNAWVAFWHAVCSWQLQDNHFKTPVKIPNKPFIDCQSGFTWVRYDSPPPSSSSHTVFFFPCSLRSLIWQLLFLIFSPAISRGSIWCCWEWGADGSSAHTDIKYLKTKKHTWARVVLFSCRCSGRLTYTVHCVCRSRKRKY